MISCGHFPTVFGIDVKKFYDGTYRERYADGFRDWNSGSDQCRKGECRAGWGNKAIGQEVYRDSHSVGIKTHFLGVKAQGNVG